jgi:L-alanine-DL-glutamate epimerase-like enolase superfamily enzyme
MQITQVIAHPLAYDNPEPVWTAHEPFSQSRIVLVEVRTDAGVTGFGEIAAGAQKTVCGLLAAFADVIKGMDPRGHDAIWRKLMSVTCPRPGGIGGWDGMPAPLPRSQRADAMAAIGGIDIALWDIKAKSVNLPVFRLLGGTRTEVFTYATGGFYRVGAALESYADEFAGFAAEGYRAVKLKTGALSQTDEVARICAIRAAIDPAVLLMLDMNAPYDVEDCIAFAKAVAPFDIFWLEEPLFWYLQPSDFRRLAEASPIPLAHGERELHRFTVRDFIDSGAIKYVQFDSTRAAGFSESLRIATYAEQKGVIVSPHSAPHIHAHLVSAMGDAAFAVESFGVSDRRHPIQNAIYQGGITVKNGVAQLSEAPGFGVTIDWDAVQHFRVT